VPRRYGVVGTGHLHVPVEVHGAVAVLVETEGLDRERLKERGLPENEASVRTLVQAELAVFPSVERAVRTLARFVAYWERR